MDNFYYPSRPKGNVLGDLVSKNLFIVIETRSSEE